MIKQKHTNLKGSEQKFASEPFFCTGTSDMVDDCVTMGLKIPEFTQDSNFRVIIWRKNGLTSGKNDPSSGQNGLTSVKNNPNIKANLSKNQL